MANFEAAIKKTLMWEGGLVDDPNDAGGLTNYGISQRAYPQLDIRALTPEKAHDIYRRDYWNQVKGDSFVNQRLANAVFDAGVNLGVHRASKMLQLVVGTEPDGVIGPVTLRALHGLPPETVLSHFTLRRIGYYADLARRRANQRRFLGGWLNRTLSFA